MRIGYTPEQEELRRELRAYFTKLMTPERAQALSSSDGEMGRGTVYRDTVAQMGKDGWLTLSWPKEFGGQEGRGGGAGGPQGIRGGRPPRRWTGSSSTTRPRSPTCRSLS